jgi:hypothetical protein
LGRSQQADAENRRLFMSAPAWARRARAGFILWHRLRRLWLGSYSQKPFSYSLYTLQNSQERVLHHVNRPTVRCA